MPSAFEEIKGPENQVIWSKESNNLTSKRVLSTEVADTMNSMLKEVVSKGTAKAASIQGREVAGKTGTSEANRDLWFIGSVPELTTGVWLGYDNNQSSNSSSGEAAFIWKQYMQKIEGNFKVLKFPYHERNKGE